jgi:hypothetical protein
VIVAKWIRAVMRRIIAKQISKKKNIKSKLITSDFSFLNLQLTYRPLTNIGIEED